MTVPSTTNRVTYVGDGTVNTYSYTYKIFLQTDLTVAVRDLLDVETILTITTDYTVTGVGESGGGTIVLVDSSQPWLDGDGDLLTGYTLSIRRVRPITQLTDIRNQGSFLPETHEDEFDRGRQVDQQQQDEIDRSIKLAESIDPATFSGTLPGTVASAPAGSAVVINGTQDGFDFAAAGLDALTVLVGTGFLSSNGATGTPRTLLGTLNEIDITNGTGASADPVFSLANPLTMPGVLNTSSLINTSADIDMTGTGRLQVSTGTTAQRPGSPAGGMVRHNSTKGVTEAYSNGEWRAVDVISNYPNKIINGNFDIWQRGTTTVVGIADGEVFPDRFKYRKTGTMVHDASQSSTVPTADFQPDFSYMTNVTTAQGSLGVSDFSALTYYVEGRDFADLKEKRATLQFYVRSTKTGIHSVSFHNSADDRTYVTTYTVDVTDTWELKKIVLNFNEGSGTWLLDEGIGLRIDFVQAAGTTLQTSTLDAWQTGAQIAADTQVNGVDAINNEFYLSQVMLVQEDFSDVVIPFRRAAEHYKGELELCRRYFFSPEFDTATTETTLGGAGGILSGGGSTYMGIQFPVVMRANPTMTFSSLGASNTTGGFYTLSSPGSTVLRPQGMYTTWTKSGGGTTGDAVFYGKSATTGYMRFDAEY